MRLIRRYWVDVLVFAAAFLVFVVPFIFVFLTAVKDRAAAAEFSFSWPDSWHGLDNIREVLGTRDGMFMTAMKNSLILTVVSVTIIVVLASMIGFTLDRRRDRVATIVSAFIMVGLMVPPAVVPTIYVLQELRLFKTLPGLILVEVAFNLSYATLLFRAFSATIPRELDEAAIIDGCNSFTLFWKVVFPLMRPVMISVILTLSVFIWSDFVNPLYFLPGAENATVQLTLFNFQSQFSNSWNLLFMDVLLITLPPLALFLMFNKKIVAGMTSGALKG